VVENIIAIPLGFVFSSAACKVSAVPSFAHQQIVATVAGTMKSIPLRR